MSQEIKAGSIVRLKSGSPSMTVAYLGEVNGRASAWCDWFDKTKKENGTFPVTSLELDE